MSDPRIEKLVLGILDAGPLCPSEVTSRVAAEDKDGVADAILELLDHGYLELTLDLRIKRSNRRRSQRARPKQPPSLMTPYEHPLYHRPDPLFIRDWIGD